MFEQFRKLKWIMTLAALCASGFVVSVAQEQSGQEQAGQKMTLSAEPTLADSSAPDSHHLSMRQSMLASRQSGRLRWTYGATGGIENLKVQQTASGTLLRFSYRVLDPNKAKALHDKKATPYLIHQKTGAMLKIPEMPNLGMMRPTEDNLVKGQECWLVFSNKGFVKPGDRVDLVIGNLRFIGLVVQ
jgi:hypothetical protein